jgi:AcrR family transcriptional regulator
MPAVQDLPIALGAAPAERVDAARNRAKILAAAEELIAERGIEQVSMDDVARRAQVGKGTLYRRFGDRANLALALLGEHEAELQEAIIRGAPPLGPGAPPLERLHAFGEAYLDVLELHAPLLAAAETPRRENLAPYLAFDRLKGAWRRLVDGAVR